MALFCFRNANPNNGHKKSNSQTFPDVFEPKCKESPKLEVFKKKNSFQIDNKSESQSPDKSFIRRTTSIRPFEKKMVIACSFCGGKNCKNENWKKNPNPPIKGLHCDWITDHMMASQRLSSRLIQEFNLIQQFKDVGINSVFCLQEPGEHPNCGDGILEKSGFSYDPEDLFKNGIYFYNFCWRDFSTTSIETILRIMKMIDFALASGNKILVHCHAGRGRTGLVICSYMIYSMKKTASEAIKIFKKKRIGGGLSKAAQRETLIAFEKYLNNLKPIFFHQPKYTMHELLMIEQKLFKVEADENDRNVHCFLRQGFKRLELFSKNNKFSTEQILKSFFDVDDACYPKPFGSKSEKRIVELKELINKEIVKSSEIEDVRYLSQLMIEFIEGLIKPPVSEFSIKNVFGNHTERTESVMKQIITSKNIKYLNKTEYYLILRIAMFMYNIQQCAEDVRDLGLLEKMFDLLNIRFCIALLHLRHKLDILFLKRTLLEADIGCSPALRDLFLIIKTLHQNYGNYEVLSNFQILSSPLPRITKAHLERKYSSNENEEGSFTFIPIKCTPKNQPPEETPGKKVIKLMPIKHKGQITTDKTTQNSTSTPIENENNSNQL